LLSSIGLPNKDYLIKGLIVSQRKRLSPAQGEIRHAVREILAAHTEPGQKLLIAVSGGADSLALASATVFESKKLKLRVATVTIDHGLQKASAKVTEQTLEKLHQIGITEAWSKKVKVGTRGGPEAAARDARYKALESIRIESKSDFIVLGHTANDQAETVLLGLTRGSGSKSLSGMSARSERLLRPILSIDRKTTEQFCKDENISPWQDPQNKNLKFLRVRIRKVVLPFLEKQLGNGIFGNLIRTSSHLQEDDQYLSGVAEKAFKKIAKTSALTVNLDQPGLLKLPAAIRNRVIKSAIDYFEVDSSRVHVLAVTDLVLNWHGQKPLALPGVRVERKGKTITLKATQEK
jgi:tRNA(Ile)-lysidine synthase